MAPQGAHRAWGATVAKIPEHLIKEIAEIEVDSFVQVLVRVTPDINENPGVHLAPPAIRMGSASGRAYVVVSPEAAWDLMERARKARCNLQQAIRLKDDEATLGCSAFCGESWMQKKDLMYQGRLSATFTQCMHWNMVADPGSHAYKEVMPIVVYGWEIDVAAFAPFQFLLPGKGITPADCEIDEDIAPYAENAKLERVAAYRQLQGLS